MRKARGDPIAFLDGVDWLQTWSQQLRAVSSLLTWIEHPLSEDELHQLSALLEHLIDDLDRQVETMYQEWQKTKEA